MLAEDFSDEETRPGAPTQNHSPVGNGHSCGVPFRRMCLCLWGHHCIPAPGFRPAHSRMNECKPKRPTPILPNPTTTALV